jgi:hypothetical protein
MNLMGRSSAGRTASNSGEGWPMKGVRDARLLMPSESGYVSGMKTAVSVPDEVF